MADFWLQEAAIAFDDVLRREAAEGRPAARERLRVLRDAYLGLREAALDRPLAELEPTGRGDAQVARTKGTWVLWMVRQALGPLTYRSIWSGAQGPPATTEALKEAVACGQWSVISRQRPTDLDHRSAGVPPLTTDHWSSFFDFWIYSTSLPQYRLLGAAAREAGGGKREAGVWGRLAGATRRMPPESWSVTLKVANQGSGTIAAPLVVQTEEGARHEFSLAVPGGGTSEVSYSTVTKPVAAAIDPEGDLLQPESSGEWQTVKIRRWL